MARTSRIDRGECLTKGDWEQLLTLSPEAPQVKKAIAHAAMCDDCLDKWEFESVNSDAQYSEFDFGMAQYKARPPRVLRHRSARMRYLRAYLSSSIWGGF